MRLLLPPLITSWPSVLSLGPPSCSSLLLLLSSAVAVMDRSAASTYTAPIFDFLLLKVFDARRQAHTHLRSHSLPATSKAKEHLAQGEKHSQQQQQAGSVGVVEGAAVCVFVSLALKCSESSFRPLFVRLMEWAAAEYAAGGEAVGAEGRMQRHIVLLGLVNGLSSRLK